MPEPTPSRSSEGWNVRAGAGLGLVAVLYILAFVGTVVAAILFGLYFPAKPARPEPAVFPAPQLNGRIDRDPGWSYAPKRQAPEGIDRAMRTLAAEGDAGWGGGRNAAAPTGAARR